MSERLAIKIGCGIVELFHPHSLFISGVAKFPGLPNRRDRRGACGQVMVREVLISAAGKLGKVSVSEPSASSVIQVRSLRSEDIVFKMI